MKIPLVGDFLVSRHFLLATYFFHFSQNLFLFRRKCVNFACCIYGMIVDCFLLFTFVKAQPAFKCLFTIIQLIIISPSTKLSV